MNYIIMVLDICADFMLTPLRFGSITVTPLSVSLSLSILALVIHFVRKLFD